MIITIGRKPFLSSVCDNTRKNQCGGINIDACRIICGDETFNEKPAYVPSYTNKIYGNGLGGGDRGTWENRKGRFPNNVFLSCACKGVCRGGCSVKILGTQSGVRTSGGGDKRPKKGSSLFFGSKHEREGDIHKAEKSTGTADRFFKVIQE